MTKTETKIDLLKLNVIHKTKTEKHLKLKLKMKTNNYN